MKTFTEHINEDNWSPLKNFKLDTNPCEGCGGKCCIGMYVDQGFITDQTEDHMKWAESHEGIEIYLSEDNNRWGIKIKDTKCKHLQENGKCGIQNNKPQSCINYYGMNPDGPFLECNLIKELIKKGYIECKDKWIKKLWPNKIPQEIKSD